VEIQFTREVEQLRLGAGATFHGEGILAITKALLENRVAAAIRTAREAALADDAGRALDATLAAQGVPPRPVRAQPVRFVRRKRGEREAA
jgi:hypothetical protein